VEKYEIWGNSVFLFRCNTGPDSHQCNPLCREGFRRAKVQLELNLTRDAKNKKSFYSYVKQKGKSKKVYPS